MPAPTPERWTDQFRMEPPPPVRPWEPCSSTRTPAPPMPTPADPLAQLLAAVLAYRPQPRAWPRPRPPYLPHPRRKLPRVRGVVRARSKP
jgi:hypothetical protein